MSITQQLRELVDELRESRYPADHSRFGPGYDAASQDIADRLDAILAAAEAATSSCTGCEGKPAGDNVPCAICGKSSVSDEDVAKFVEVSATIISGSPFPSARSYAKARQIADAALETFAWRVQVGDEAVAWMHPASIQRLVDYRAGDADGTAHAYAFAAAGNDVDVPLYAHPATPGPQAVPAPVPFQQRVSTWMGQCFLPSLYSNMTERGDRLLEEVLELLQSKDYDQARVATLVNYVWGRPVGEPVQEVGGVMVTLAGFCCIAGLDMHDAGETELARINQPEVMQKICIKQQAKNALHFDTPLPGNACNGASDATVKDRSIVAANKGSADHG